MDKKFISGVTFGVVLGTVIGLSSPMFGAKDISVKSQSTKSTANTSSNQSKADSSVSNNGVSAEMVQQLKDISNSLKENSEQNKQIIQQLQNFNKKTGLGD